MNTHLRIDRRTALAALLVPLAGGCLPLPETGPEPASSGDSGDGPEEALGTDPSQQGEPRNSQLREMLDVVLADGFQRTLDVEINGAWQVLHGILAYGLDCRVRKGTETKNAVEYLLTGGKLAGFDPLKGDLLGEPPRRGIRFELEPYSMSGQGHRDQWLAVLSQTGLTAETPLVYGDSVGTLDDAVRQTLWDIPRNLEREYSWTVIGLTAYRPTDFTWQARDGARWSVEGLVESEVAATLEEAACGGTHRLIGLAMTVSRHRAAGGTFSPVWESAQRRIDDSIDLARQFQNGDGSFSTTYLHRYGWSPDMSDVLRTTGHVLEFLSLAGSDALLVEPWVESAVRRLCDVLRSTRHLDLECGALYHALHGVVLYRNRRFADKPWSPQQIATVAS
jgi:hypothetical protein